MSDINGATVRLSQQTLVKKVLNETVMFKVIDTTHDSKPYYVRFHMFFFFNFSKLCAYDTTHLFSAGNYSHCKTLAKMRGSSNEAEQLKLFVFFLPTCSAHCTHCLALLFRFSSQLPSLSHPFAPTVCRLDTTHLAPPTLWIQNHPTHRNHSPHRTPKHSLGIAFCPGASEMSIHWVYQKTSRRILAVKLFFLF